VFQEHSCTTALMLGMQQITCTKFKFAFTHSLPRKGKIKSNITSDERANIWEMKPKWNL